MICKTITRLLVAAAQLKAPEEQQKLQSYARNHLEPVTTARSHIVSVNSGVALARPAAAAGDALVGVHAGVDPLAVDVDGLRQGVGAGGVALLADAARRPGEPALEDDEAPDGVGVAAERAGEHRVQLRRLLGRRHRLPRLPLPHGRWSDHGSCAGDEASLQQARGAGADATGSVGLRSMGAMVAIYMYWSGTVASDSTCVRSTLPESESDAAMVVALTQKL